MALATAEYNFDSLKNMVEEYKHKSLVMREICSLKHEKIIFWETVRIFGTTATSIIVITLTFFGTVELAATTGLDKKHIDIFFSFSSLALVLFAVFQLVKNKSQISFVFYKGIQDFSTIINLSDYISMASTMSNPKASEAAANILELYDQAIKDIPRTTNKEYDEAKKALSH